MQPRSPIVVIVYKESGIKLNSFLFSILVPCCPVGLTAVQVTQSIINVSWTIGTVAQTYVTVLESQIGQSKCHTHQNHCLLGCIACGINYTVALKAISPTGLTADCAYQSYSSSK